MISPAIEVVPDFIFFPGKKDLSAEMRFELNKLISKLEKVVASESDKAVALGRIGILHGYMNNYEDALSSFYNSLLIEYSEVHSENYIQALERLSRPIEAIDESIKILEINPNNENFFKVLLDLMSKYPYEKGISMLEKCINYINFDNMEVKIYVESKIKSIRRNNNILNLFGIDRSYYYTLISIAYSVVKQIQVGGVSCKPNIDQVTESLTVKVIVKNIDYSDIIFLNKRFDEEVFSRIQTGLISKDVYFDHLEKLVVGFSITSSVGELV